MTRAEPNRTKVLVPTLSDFETLRYPGRTGIRMPIFALNSNLDVSIQPHSGRANS